MADTKPYPIGHRLATRLKASLEGDILFDAFSRGRYSTDASHYQIEPIGVVIPRSDEDVQAALTIAREEGVPLLPRGGATSQSGQTVGRALVVDFSKYLNKLLEFNQAERTCVVQPGIVLDDLNRHHRQPRDHRWHGRKQLLRHSFDSLWHHARQRCRHRCAACRRFPGAVR
jgi:hypothetical protein